MFQISSKKMAGDDIDNKVLPDCKSQRSRDSFIPLCLLGSN